jgi:6-pyruvoyltetrahydropterin/6-carboxytetrahydropterin synthase
MFGMFTISVQNSFAARHRLSRPDGTKEPSHGHYWTVTAAASAEKLNAAGLVMDFQLLRDLVEKVVGPLRDAELDRLEYFRSNNCSAENVAKYIYEAVVPLLPAPVRLDYVQVTEAAGCTAAYRSSPAD